MLNILSTMERGGKNRAKQWLYYLEIFIMIQLSVEFGLRIWSCGCRSRYQGFWGRMLFMKRFFCLLDLVIVCGSIISTIVEKIELDNSSDFEISKLTNQTVVTGTVIVPLELIEGTTANVLNPPSSDNHASNSMWTGTLRLLRFLQIIRIVRLERGLGRGNSWKLLASVVRAHLRELMTSLYIGFIILLLGSYAVYQIEADHNSQFSNYGDALWWGIVSLTTIGYGKHVPETAGGRVVSSLFLIRK